MARHADSTEEFSLALGSLLLFGLLVFAFQGWESVSLTSLPLPLNNFPGGLIRNRSLERRGSAAGYRCPWLDCETSTFRSEHVCSCFREKETLIWWIHPGESVFFFFLPLLECDDEGGPHPTQYVIYASYSFSHLGILLRTNNPVHVSIPALLAGTFPSNR